MKKSLLIFIRSALIAAPLIVNTAVHSMQPLIATHTEKVPDQLPNRPLHERENNRLEIIRGTNDNENLTIFNTIKRHGKKNFFVYANAIVLIAAFYFFYYIPRSLSIPNIRATIEQNTNMEPNVFAIITNLYNFSKAEAN